MAEELIFNEEYEKLTTGTRAHADKFNKIFDLLLANDKFLKYAADSITEKMLEKGMIVDNFTSERSDLPGSAANDKRLYDMIDDVNKNINTNTHLLFGGTPIERGSDLDDFLSVGNYHCASTDAAQTIKNRPPNMDVAFTFKVCSGTGQSFTYLRQELIEFNTGIKHIRINTTGVKGGWGEWDRFVLNSDLKPIIGTSITNTIPSRKGTTVNRISNLSPGTYMIYGFAQYTTEFSETCNYSLYQDNNLISICRANSIGGGGQTPFGIVSFDTISNLEFNLYQSSNDTKEIVRSKLVAVRLN